METTLLVTPPSNLAVSLEELKDHLRITINEDDDLLTSYIKTAVSEVEHRSRRQLISATYKQVRDNFPNGKILLQRPPLQSVTSIVFVSTDGSSVTLDEDEYWTATNSLVGYVQPKTSWPSVANQPGAVVITYICGYGDSTTDVCEAGKHAVRLLAGHYYENREATGPKLDVLPFAVDSLIQQIAVKEII